MTEKQDTDPTQHLQAVQISLRNVRREGLDELRSALAALSAGDFAELVFAELARRTLDEHGNPTDQPGLYKAATISTLALLGINEGLGNDVLAGNLAAVGRGVQVRSKTKDASVEISEVAELVDAFWEPGDEFAASNIPPEQRAGMLAKTLAKRFGRPVAEQDIAEALQRSNRNGAITDVVIAVGIKKLGERTTRDGVLRSVDTALKQRLR